MRLDIAAATDNGARIKVEIHCRDAGNIAYEIVFFNSNRAQSEPKEGENYNTIPDIITIWICGASVHVDTYKNNRLDPAKIASEKMRRFIIELIKLENTPKSFCNDMFAVWMKFAHNPDDVPEEFWKMPEVKEAMDELNAMSIDKAARAEYEARMKELNDFHAGNAGNTTSYKRGKEEGRAEGIKKRERKKAIKTAKSMLKYGVSVASEYDSERQSA